MERPDGIRIGALYIRVSTDSQTELSPDAQKREGLKWAKQNNIVIPPEFIFMEPRGISGRQADKRPEFKKMIGMAKDPDHPFDVILVWKFSRFARNQEESIVYKSLLRKSGVEVVSVSEPIPDGIMGGLIERILEWMDEYYSIRLSGEVIRGMTEKALRGGYQLVPCLGYSAVGHGEPYVINEDEFKIVERMAYYYDVENLDFTAIARRINAAGYLTRRGNPFEARGVERILTNPFYCGTVSWRGMEFEGTHEVRFTREQYEQRMARIRSEKRHNGERSMSGCKHWLSGIVKCPYCGKNLSYCSEARMKSGKKRIAFFQCYQYSKGRHPESAGISEQKLIRGVYAYFEDIIGGADFEYTYRRPSDAAADSELNHLQDELKRLRTKESRVRMAYENGIDTLDEYRENRARLRSEKEEIQANIDRLSGSAPEFSREDVLERARCVYDVIRDPDVDYASKGSCLRSLVDEIVYDKSCEKLRFRIFVS